MVRRREKPTVMLPADGSLPTCAPLLTPDARLCQYRHACLSPPLACELPGQDPCQTSQPRGPQDLVKCLACGGTSSTVTEGRGAAAVPGPGARSRTTSAAAAWALLAVLSDQGLSLPAGAGAGPWGARKCAEGCRTGWPRVKESRGAATTWRVGGLHSDEAAFGDFQMKARHTHTLCPARGV